MADEIGLTPAERNPFRSILIRAIETIHACEVALAIAEGYSVPERSFVPVEPRLGVGCGWSEAPRGLLWHRYEIDDVGRIAAAQIASTDPSEGASTARWTRSPAW